MQPLAPFSAGSLSPRGSRPEDSAGRRHFATGAFGTPRFPPCAASVVVSRVLPAH